MYYHAETMPAVGDTITATHYHDDGGTSFVTGTVTRAGSIAGWFQVADGREERFEFTRTNAPRPLYTYSDTHTGEFDNYAHTTGDTMALYAYHGDHTNPGVTHYREAFSTVLHRTNRTVEGDRAEDPDAWEPATDTYSPEHDVNPGLTGDEIAVDGTVWAVDYAATVPPLPAGWPTTRPLAPAPGRPGWQDAPEPRYYWDTTTQADADAMAESERERGQYAPFGDSTHRVIDQDSGVVAYTESEEDAVLLTAALNK